MLREDETMLGIAAMTAILLGGLWLADSLFGFRFESTEALYPFQASVRQAAAICLLGIGAVLAWIESRIHIRRLHH